MKTGEQQTAENHDVVLKPSNHGIIVTIARECDSSGKQIGKLAAEPLGIVLKLQQTEEILAAFENTFFPQFTDLSGEAAAVNLQIVS